MKRSIQSFLQQQSSGSGNDDLDQFVRSSMDHLVDAISAMMLSTLQRVYGTERGTQVNNQLAYCMIDAEQQIGPFFLDFATDWYRHFITCGMEDPSVRIGQMVGDLNDLFFALNFPCADYVDPDIDLVVDIPKYYEPIIRNAVQTGYQQFVDAFNNGLQARDRLSDAATDQFLKIALNSMNINIDPNYMYDLQEAFTVTFDTPLFEDIGNLMSNMMVAATESLLNSTIAIMEDLEYEFTLMSENNQFNDEQMTGFFWGNYMSYFQTLENVIEELQRGEAPTQEDANNLANFLVSQYEAWRQYSYFNYDWNNFLGQYIPIICQMKSEAESELRTNIRQTIDPID